MQSKKMKLLGLLAINMLFLGCGKMERTLNLEVYANGVPVVVDNLLKKLHWDDGHIIVEFSKGNAEVMEGLALESEAGSQIKLSLLGSTGLEQSEAPEAVIRRVGNQGSEASMHSNGPIWNMPALCCFQVLAIESTTASE